MARKLRVEYSGAIYHVINRGNYRRDLFMSPGEGAAFLETVKAAKDRMGWLVHAYVLMRNHYHLAIETPEPNLAQGMQWLQATWANRFNRFRKENGHLFQGRYRAILLEGSEALGRVVDYIHLNPVRAKIVTAEQVRSYRWSSLGTVVRGDGWVSDEGWRAAGRFGADEAARKAYEAYLVEVGRDETAWERLGLVGLSKGWALGTQGWRRAMAKEHASTALTAGLAREEARQVRELAWENAVKESLGRAGKSDAELAGKPYLKDWKLRVAREVRDQSGASVAWLAQRLCLGRPASLRSYLSRTSSNLKNQQTTA